MAMRGSLSFPGWESTRGEKSRRAKISEATAQAILDLRGSCKAVAVAERFGVSVRIVRNIWNRRRWVHLQQQREIQA